MCFFSSDPILEGCVGSAHSHAIRQFPYRTKGTNKKVKKRIEVKDYGTCGCKKKNLLVQKFPRNYITGPLQLSNKSVKEILLFTYILKKNFQSIYHS